MLWIFWTFVSVILRAAHHLGSKYVLEKKIPSGIQLIMASFFPNLFYAVTIYLVLRPVIELTIVSVLSILSGIILVIQFLAYLRALKIEEASRIAPLVHTYPVFVAILAAIFLGEIFSLGIYVGIVMVILGSILLAFRSEKGMIRKIPALELTFLAVSIIAVVIIIERWVFGFYDYWTFFFYNTTGWFLGSLTLFFNKNFRIGFRKTFLENKANIGYYTVLEVLGISAILSILYAIYIGTATLVASLSAITPLFVLVFATLLSFKRPDILKEELGKVIWLKLLAILLIVLGVYLIT